DDRDPAGSAELERGKIHAAGTVAIAQVPGHGRGIDHADGGLAVAVPVADHGQPAGEAEGEGSNVRGPAGVGIAQEPVGRVWVEDADSGFEKGLHRDRADVHLGTDESPEPSLVGGDAGENAEEEAAVDDRAARQRAARQGWPAVVLERT